MYFFMNPYEYIYYSGPDKKCKSTFHKILQYQLFHLIHYIHHCFLVPAIYSLFNLNINLNSRGIIYCKLKTDTFVNLKVTNGIYSFLG